MRHVAHILGALAAAAWAANCQAQLLSGDFDTLPIGTAPDNTAPAGAWYFPANYVGAGYGEVTANDFTIVQTSSFSTGPGNSLALGVNSGTAAIYLTNILASPILEAPGRIVRVTLRVWARQQGVGAGTFFVGADLGGGGYYATTDRGPQLAWSANGTLAYVTLPGVTYHVIVPSYPVGQWQQVRLDIHLDTDTFDAWWAPDGQPLVSVGTGLGFRWDPITMIDRVTFAHFSSQGFHESAYFDDLTLEVIDTCYPNCDGNGALDINDFICFQTKFALGDPYADCDGNGATNVSDYICFQTKFALGVEKDRKWQIAESG